jgi:tripartite-type tricarboxylate transporter receptor subunit TctC
VRDERAAFPKSEGAHLAAKDGNVISQFAALATTPPTGEEATPTALKTKLESEVARWAPVIRAAGTYAN